MDGALVRHACGINTLDGWRMVSSATIQRRHDGNNNEKEGVRSSGGSDSIKSVFGPHVRSKKSR